MKKRRVLLSPFAHRIIIATAILLFALLYLYEIGSLKPQDKLLVNPVIWIIILLYPIIIWQEWRQFKSKQEEQSNQVAKEDVDADTSAKLTKKIFFFMLSTIGYLILMNYLGFFIMTILYMPLLMWILGTKSKSMLIFLPIITTVVLFILFDLVLDIPLPQGLFLQGVF